MIIRVTINVDTIGRSDCEKILFYSCDIYTDEEYALKSTDDKLRNYNLSDGCTLGSNEDIVALNAQLAERFNDPYNLDARVEWEDITDMVIDRIHEDFYDVPWSDKDLMHMAYECGIDLNEL